MAQRDRGCLSDSRTQVPSLVWRCGLKDQVLPRLWCRSQRWLGSDPWPGNSICCAAAKKEKPEEINEKSWKTTGCLIPSLREHNNKDYNNHKASFLLFFSSFFNVFVFFRATPAAYVSSAAASLQPQQHRIQAVSATYTAAHSSVGSLTH